MTQETISLLHVLGNIHIGKKFLNQYFKAEGFIRFGNQLIQYTMNSEDKQYLLSSSLLLFLFRCCSTATSSFCLFLSLFELHGKFCAFPVGIGDGVKPFYLFVKTTVVFVLTTENCLIKLQTPRNV